MQVDIRPAYEFRGFVFGRKLTCISSYNRAVHWPDVAPHKKLIEERLVKYWSGVENKITRSVGSVG